MSKVRISFLISFAALFQLSSSMNALTRKEAGYKGVPGYSTPKDGDHEYTPDYTDDDKRKLKPFVPSNHETKDIAKDIASEKTKLVKIDSNAPFKQLVNGSTPTGWVQIGTPKKWLYVIFDTGSDKLVAKTWETIASELSSVDQGVAGMFVPSDNIYNHESSNTYARKFVTDPNSNQSVPEEASITYGSGTAITDVGQDTITVGNRELQNFTLMEITADSLQLLHTSKGVAGVLGLQHMKNQSLGHSLFSRLRDAGKMTAFGYCRGTGNNGSFIWGAPEPTGSSGKTVDVVGQMHWAVKIGNISVTGLANADTSSANASSSGGAGGASGWGGANSSGSSLLAKRAMSPDFEGEDPSAEEASSDESSDDPSKTLDALTKVCTNSSCIGILDSGSNIMAGPTDVMKGITNLLNVQPDCSNFDKLPVMTLNFGGYQVDVPPAGYVMKVPKADVSTLDDGGSDDGQGGGSGQQAAGLAETSSDVQAAIKRQWMATFERLRKSRGIDFGAVLKEVLKNENATKEEFLCMPALVPIDKHTPLGPLYIVGTPLLQAYYARWGFGQNATSPQIHLQPLAEAEACKDDSNAQVGDSAPTNKLMRSHEHNFKDHKHSHARHHRPRVQLLEEIRYPHWAESLLHL